MRLNDSFNFPLGLIKYIVIVVVVKTPSYLLTMLRKACVFSFRFSQCRYVSDGIYF